MQPPTTFPPYPNQPRTDADLVQLLLDRGLKADVAELASAVSAVGYYRLKGYLVPFANRFPRGHIAI